MPTRRSRILLALLFVTVLAAALMGWRVFLQKRAVARVKAAIDGRVTVGAIRGHAIPESVDKLIGTVRGLGKWYPTDTASGVWRYLVGVDLLHIEVKSIRGDIAGAIAQFPELRHLIILGDDRTVTTEDWQRLCAATQTLRKLQVLQLEGRSLQDDGIAPLAGHPSVFSMYLKNGRISPKSIPTFTSLPALRYLCFEEDTGSPAPLSADERKAIETALDPKNVTFR
jgi:hypothetical protein